MRTLSHSNEVWAQKVNRDDHDDHRDHDEDVDHFDYRDDHGDGATDVQRLELLLVRIGLMAQ